MTQKRQEDDPGGGGGGGGGGHVEKRRKFCWKRVVQEVMSARLLEPVLEPLIRRVVREEIEIAMEKHLSSMRWSGGNEIESYESRNFKLMFCNNLFLPVFTGARIRGEECSALKVILVNTVSETVVCSGPESSARVEIVVLEGDFDSDESHNWTTEEFKNNIVKERNGRKPLLTGDAFLNLEEGTGSIGNISFTDNSSWTRSRKFKLGARVVDNFDRTRVREATTESFIVRDHRGELYKKHHPPFLQDEVWRLEKIGKDGAFHKRLSHEKISNVQEFLILLNLDPSRLRNILGTGMSPKMWEAATEHARTCMIGKRVYLYRPTTCKGKAGVVFNVVGQVIGLLSESQYVPIDKLSETEKVDAQKAVICAFQHREEVMPFDDEATLISGASSLSSNDSFASNSTAMDSTDAGNILASKAAVTFNYSLPSSPLFSVMGLDDYDLHNIDNLGLRYDQTVSLPGQVSVSDIHNPTAFSHEDHMLLFDIGSPDSHKATHEMQDDSCSLARSSVDKAQRRWRKVFNVLQWFFVRKRVVERRTRSREIHRAKKNTVR